MTLKSALEVTRDHSNWYHSTAWVQFPIRLPQYNYGSISHHFQDKAKYWSKFVIFSYPLHSMPPLGGSPSEYCHPFGTEKLEWWGYLTVNRL